MSGLMKNLSKCFGRFLKIFLKFSGGVCFIIGCLIAFWYFYLDDRILYIFPNLAQEVTLAQIVENPEKYDDKWVRVKGELWNPRKYWATFVPPGTGPKKMTAEQIKAWYEKRKDRAYLTVADTQNTLPEAHVTLHAFGRRMNTVSLLGIGRGKTVEIAGEFEKPVWYKGKDPVIDVAAIINPGQSIYWISIVLMGFTSLFFIIVGVTLFRTSSNIYKWTDSAACEESKELIQNTIQSLMSEKRLSDGTPKKRRSHGYHSKA